MGKIIRNGIEYSGSYDNAISINYDNTNSGLNATTVQEGIDEIKEDLKPHANVNPIANLLTTETGYALDATQGKVLDDKISAVSNSLIKYHIFTTTTDSNGFVPVPNTVVRPSTGMVLFAVETTTPKNVTFHNVIQAASDDYSIRCCYWDNTVGINANVSKTIKIAYVLF